MAIEMYAANCGIFGSPWSTEIALKIGWIPRNFRIFIFKVNHKNFNKGQLSDFNGFTLHINFAYFLKMTIPMIAIYGEKLKRSYVG